MLESELLRTVLSALLLGVTFLLPACPLREEDVCLIVGPGEPATPEPRCGGGGDLTLKPQAWGLSCLFPALLHDRQHRATYTVDALLHWTEVSISTLSSRTLEGSEIRHWV